MASARNADYAVAVALLSLGRFSTMTKAPANVEPPCPVPEERAARTATTISCMRDTFSRRMCAQSWWEWLNLDAADLISVDGTAFDPAKHAAG